MSRREAGTASYWDHREARTVSRPVTPPLGGQSPAALAAAARAAAAKDAEAFWEPHYASMATGTDGPLPGPNPVLVDVIAGVAPGKALDLGCGQGGDAFWLAQRGWAVTSVDVSATALERVAARAQQVGLRERVVTEKHDLSATFPEGGFDLVNAQYLHSPVEMDRAAALRLAAAAVLPGGMLLVVDHASVPPWSWKDPDSVFPTPRQTLDGIGLDLRGWQVVGVPGPGAAKPTDMTVTGGRCRWSGH